MVSPSASWRQSVCDIGNPAIFTIGAVMTMRVNQQPRLIAA